jgi:hypothetical protein
MNCKFMKNRRTVFLLCPALLFAAQIVRAQNGADGAALNADPAEQRSPNRFGLSYRLGLNTPVSFKNLGGYAALPAGATSRLTPDGDPYNYNDGYVYNDVNNGAFGSTWYWGYDAAPGQYTLGADSVIMHRSSSPANVTSKDDDVNPLHGFEVSYNRELFQHGERLRGGLEAAFGFMPIGVTDSSTLNGDVVVSGDAFAVPKDTATGYGITYFPSLSSSGPWQNNKAGTLHPGDAALIGNGGTAVPSQVIPGAAIIAGSRQFDANFYGFRLGPYLEFEAHPRLDLVISAGLAVAYIESDFSYQQTVSIAGIPDAQSQNAASSQSGWCVGGFVSGTVSYKFARDWAAVAGAQFMGMGQYTHNLNNKQAVLDLRQSVFVTVGVSYSF